MINNQVSLELIGVVYIQSSDEKIETLWCFFSQFLFFVEIENRGHKKAQVITIWMSNVCLKSQTIESAVFQQILKKNCVFSNWKHVFE